MYIYVVDMRAYYSGYPRSIYLPVPHSCLLQLGRARSRYSNNRSQTGAAKPQCWGAREQQIIPSNGYAPLLSAISAIILFISSSCSQAQCLRQIMWRGLACLFSFVLDLLYGSQCHAVTLITLIYLSEKAFNDGHPQFFLISFARRSNEALLRWPNWPLIGDFSSVHSL